MLKRGTKKQEKSNPLLSDSYERMPDYSGKNKKAWKLFKGKPKNSSGRNKRQTSYEYDYENDDYYYKDDEDAMKAWEPAPSFLPFPSQAQETSEQPLRMQIADNETTTKTLSNYAKQQQQSQSDISQNVLQEQAPAKPPTYPKQPIQEQPRQTNPRSPKKSSPTRKVKPLVVPAYLKTTKAVLARPFGRESLLVKDCTVGWEKISFVTLGIILTFFFCKNSISSGSSKYPLPNGPTIHGNIASRSNNGKEIPSSYRIMDSHFAVCRISDGSKRL